MLSDLFRERAGKSQALSYNVERKVSSGDLQAEIVRKCLPGAVEKGTRGTGG